MVAVGGVRARVGGGVGRGLGCVVQVSPPGNYYLGALTVKLRSRRPRRGRGRAGPPGAAGGLFGDSDDSSDDEGGKEGGGPKTTIYYTTDGTEPNPRYALTAPLNVDLEPGERPLRVEGGPGRGMVVERGRGCTGLS